MKKTIFSFISAFLLVVVLFAGCKSAPKPVDEPPVEEPKQITEAPKEAEEVKVDQELIDLRDKAESLSAIGLKYGFNTYVPDSWNAAETARKAGLDAFGKDNEASRASFKSAIALHEALQNEAFLSILKDQHNQITKAREEAILLGAKDYFPEQFDMAETSTRLSKQKQNENDLLGAYDAAQTALLRYKTLINSMKTIALKDKIEQNDFVQYSEEDYNSALSDFDVLGSLYGVQDLAAYEASTQILAKAEKINNEGFRHWSIDEKVKTEESLFLCDSIKAQKAATVAYDKAKSTFKEADALGQANTWESAYYSYTSATRQFADVYQSVLLKRNAADLAIATAKARQDASTELAKRADEQIPLPEDAEGFSDEPLTTEVEQ